MEPQEGDSCRVLLAAAGQMGKGKPKSTPPRALGGFLSLQPRRGTWLSPAFSSSLSRLLSSPPRKLPALRICAGSESPCRGSGLLAQLGYFQVSLHHGLRWGACHPSQPSITCLTPSVAPPASRESPPLQPAKRGLPTSPPHLLPLICHAAVLGPHSPPECCLLLPLPAMPLRFSALDPFSWLSPLLLQGPAQELHQVPPSCHTTYHTVISPSSGHLFEGRARVHPVHS